MLNAKDMAYKYSKISNAKEELNRVKRYWYELLTRAKHQFIEGDVEHWWHEETNRGIRTRFSDDLLWLCYVTSEYIEYTGDKSLLDIEIPYLQGELLEDGVDERYDLYLESKEKGNLYEHCIKAIEKSLNFGENGLPKIGSGDWNDGMNTCLLYTSPSPRD